mgnify:CR=1 FL=1
MKKISLVVILLSSFLMQGCFLSAGLVGSAAGGKNENYSYSEYYVTKLMDNSKIKDILNQASMELGYKTHYESPDGYIYKVSGTNVAENFVGISKWSQLSVFISPSKDTDTGELIPGEKVIMLGVSVAGNFNKGNRENAVELINQYREKLSEKFDSMDYTLTKK